MQARLLANALPLPRGLCSAAPAPLLLPLLPTFMVMTRSVGSRPSTTHCCSVSRFSGLHPETALGQMASGCVWRRVNKAEQAMRSSSSSVRTCQTHAFPLLQRLHSSHAPVPAAVGVVEAAQRHPQPQRRLPALKAQPRLAPCDAGRATKVSGGDSSATTTVAASSSLSKLQEEAMHLKHGSCRRGRKLAHRSALSGPCGRAPTSCLAPSRCRGPPAWAAHSNRSMDCL